MILDILGGASNAISIVSTLLNLTKRSDVKIECNSCVLFDGSDKLPYLDIIVINNGAANITVRSWKLGFGGSIVDKSRSDVLEYVNQPGSYLYAVEDKCPTLLVPSYMCHYYIDALALGKWLYKMRDAGVLTSKQELSVLIFLSNGDTLCEMLDVTIDSLICDFNKKRLTDENFQFEDYYI